MLIIDTLQIGFDFIWLLVLYESKSTFCELKSMLYETES